QQSAILIDEVAHDRKIGGFAVGRIDREGVLRIENAVAVVVRVEQIGDFVLAKRFGSVGIGSGACDVQNLVVIAEPVPVVIDRGIVKSASHAAAGLKDVDRAGADIGNPD